MAVVWSFPLVRHLPTHLPGPGPGDNVDFLWNFWWMRTALASGLDFFHTTYVFVPTGADLTLHTHTALPAFLGATVLGGLSVVAAQNLTILAALFLNGFCAYLLAWRVARDHGAAMIGGLVFGGSPYIAAHLNGHFNLTTAWTIPLFAIAASEAIRESTTRWAVVAGLLLGATAYVDYYYLVYEFALALCLVALAAREWSIVSRGPSPRSRPLTMVVRVLILVDITVIAAMIVTGGINTRIGRLHIFAPDIFNPLQAFWILVAFLLWLRLRPRVESRRRETWAPARLARAVPIMTGVFLVAAAPLVRNGVGLFLRGEYVTPRILLAKRAEGHRPGHACAWQPVPRSLGRRRAARLSDAGHRRHGIDRLAGRRANRARGVGAATTRRSDFKSRDTGRPFSRRSEVRRSVRQWAVIGLVFFVWALGPHLMAFGINTGMILPVDAAPLRADRCKRPHPRPRDCRLYLALAVLGAITAAEWRRGLSLRAC